MRIENFHSFPVQVTHRDACWHEINFSETAMQSPPCRPESNSSGLNLAPVLLKTTHQAFHVYVYTCCMTSVMLYHLSAWPIHSACESEWNVKTGVHSVFLLTVLAKASGMWSWIQLGCAVIYSQFTGINLREITSIMCSAVHSGMPEDTNTDWERARHPYFSHDHRSPIQLR